LTVRDIASVTEDEMVLAWLRAEVNSPNWGKYIRQGLAALGQDEKLILQPDLTSKEQNALRAQLLGYRGYNQNLALFQRFPDDVTWRLVELNRDDFSKLLYLNNERTWHDLSDTTRSAVVGARNISSGNKSNASIEGVVEAIKRGEKNFLPIIAVEKGEHLVLMEGHTRATAYVVTNHEPVQAIVGSSPLMQRWHWY
jgi:hypothetical protein